MIPCSYADPFMPCIGKSRYGEADVPAIRDYRQGQEVECVRGVKYYAAELVPLTFFDENDNPIAKVDMEIGDVVQPLAVGFIPFHPSINLNARSPKFEKSMSKRHVSTGNNLDQESNARCEPGYKCVWSMSLFEMLPNNR